MGSCFYPSLLFHHHTSQSIHGKRIHHQLLCPAEPQDTQPRWRSGQRVLMEIGGLTVCVSDLFSTLSEVGLFHFITWPHQNICLNTKQPTASNFKSWRMRIDTRSHTVCGYTDSLCLTKININLMQLCIYVLVWQWIWPYLSHSWGRLQLLLLEDCASRLRQKHYLYYHSCNITEWFTTRDYWLKLTQRSPSKYRFTCVHFMWSIALSVQLMIMIIITVSIKLNCYKALGETHKEQVELF